MVRERLGFKTLTPMVLRINQTNQSMMFEENVASKGW